MTFSLIAGHLLFFITTCFYVYYEMGLDRISLRESHKNKKLYNRVTFSFRKKGYPKTRKYVRPKIQKKAPSS